MPDSSVEVGYPVTRVREGLAEIIVPDPERYKRPDGVYEPAWAPVFYNPRMAFNRDIAVLFLRAFARLRGVREPVVFEPLAGTGVRAVRYALEAGARVYASDIDADAVFLARVNVEANGVASRVRIERSDANIYMRQLSLQGVKPHLIDLDPFGSPIPFIDAALDAIVSGSVIAVTATDTAPLSGTHLHALRRKYDVIPARTSWEKEQALRILIGYLIRRAASKDIALQVLLAYYADHYVRAYLLALRGARRANKALEKLSYALWCPSCGYVAYTGKPVTNCPLCYSRAVILGPLYQGPLCDKRIVEQMLDELNNTSWLTEPGRAKQLLETLLGECSIVKPYYRVDKLCSYLRINMPRMAELVEALRRKGYRAVRSHFDPRAVKTDAPHTIVLNTLLELYLASSSRG